MSLEQDASRGSEAKTILESRAFKDAIATVQQSVFDAFAATDPKDTLGLQEQRYRLKALADITRELASVMNTGKLAAAEIETAKTLKDRVSDSARRLVRAVF